MATPAKRRHKHVPHLDYRTYHLVEIRPKGRGQLGSRHWERSESDHHHRSYRGRQDGSRRREGGPHSSSSNSIRLPLLGDLTRWKRDDQESTSSNIDEGRQRNAAQMRFDMRAKVRFSGFSYYRAANRVRSHDQSFKFEFREPARYSQRDHTYIHDMFPFSPKTTVTCSFCSLLCTFCTSKVAGAS